MAEWWQMAGTGVVGVAVAKGFDFFRSRGRISFNREAKLWEELGWQKAKIESMEKQIEGLRKDRHEVRNELQRERLIAHMLRLEVNQLLKETGRVPKYDIETALGDASKSQLKVQT